MQQSLQNCLDAAAEVLRYNAGETSAFLSEIHSEHGKQSTGRLEVIPKGCGIRGWYQAGKEFSFFFLLALVKSVPSFLLRYFESRVFSHFPALLFLL